MCAEISKRKKHEVEASKENFRDFVFKKGLFSDILEDDSKDMKNRSHHRTAQYEYLYDAEGNLLVDFVGRFENLEDDWKKVCEKIGTKLDLPHIHKTSKSEYRSFYDEETRREVEKMYKKDLDLFGYKF